MEPSINAKRNVDYSQGNHLGAVYGSASCGKGAVGAGLEVGASKEKFFRHGTFGAAGVSDYPLINSTFTNFIYSNLNEEFCSISRFRVRRGAL